MIYRNSAGIAFVLFVQCMNALRHSSLAHPAHSRVVFFVYTCIMFMIGTAYIIANTSYKILAYTTHRDFPGGPVTWINVNYSSPTTFASNICAVVSSWGADGLLVRSSSSRVRGNENNKKFLQLYRCFIIYSNSLRAVRFILVLPIILYIGELGNRTPAFF